MLKFLNDIQYLKPWELWKYSRRGSCRIFSTNCICTLVFWFLYNPVLGKWRLQPKFSQMVVYICTCIYSHTFLENELKLAKLLSLSNSQPVMVTSLAISA